MDFTTRIKGRVLEYFDDEHLYLVDGVEVPSITTILKDNRYRWVDKEVLRKAAEAGNAVHKAIEDYCTEGKESDLPELKGFKTIQETYGFRVLQNEVPVILFDFDEPIAAGRVDLVLEMDGQIGGADIKRTSVLDREYLFYQLNIYRIAFFQSYGVEWEFLRGVHLRDHRHRFVQIPIDNEAPMKKVYEYLEDLK